MAEEQEEKEQYFEEINELRIYKKINREFCGELVLPLEKSRAVEKFHLRVNDNAIWLIYRSHRTK